jgi:L-threonylcarbamoyladenylate synthase
VAINNHLSLTLTIFRLRILQDLQLSILMHRLSYYYEVMSLSVSQQLVFDAANILHQGDLVAFPTETVYGLGADAGNADALAKLYAVKGRPVSHPVIVHLADAGQMNHWATDIPPAAWVLADAFWPGPLTLILPRASHVLDAITGGQNTVGLRVPSHPLAQALLQAFGRGLAAPSANRFGRISPTKAAHVREDFSDAELPWLLDGGDCAVGVESTIVAFQHGFPFVLRPGMITTEQIKAVCSSGGERIGTLTDVLPIPSLKELTQQEHYSQEGDLETIRVSGLLTRHYAPRTKLYLVPGFRLMATVEARLAAMASLEIKRREAPVDFSQKAKPTRFGVLARQAKPAALGLFGQQVRWVQAAKDAKTYAQELYAHLHALDALGLDVLLLEAVPENNDWAAIADRLRRASARA